MKILKICPLSRLSLIFFLNCKIFCNLCKWTQTEILLICRKDKMSCWSLVLGNKSEKSINDITRLSDERLVWIGQFSICLQNFGLATKENHNFVARKSYRYLSLDFTKLIIYPWILFYSFRLFIIQSFKVKILFCAQNASLKFLIHDATSIS